MNSAFFVRIAIAFGLSVSLHLGIAKVLRSLGMLDFPEKYGLSRKKLPYPTGAAAVLTFLVMFIGMEALNMQHIGMLLAVSILAIISFTDDRIGIPALPRLLIQVGCSSIIFATGSCLGGRICSLTNPLEGILGGPFLELNSQIPVLALVVTVIWLMLTTNALNWFDGISGQVHVLSGIAFTIIAVLSLSDRVGQPELALIAGLLAAIAFGGLVLDVPVRGIMGDTGTMFFGFMLGILTIYSGGKVATAFLVLGVPLIDVGIVVIERIWNGKSPFTGGSEHLHHRLLKKGWKPWQVILLTAGLGTAFGITALFLSTLEKFIAGLILLIIMILLSLYASRSSLKTKN